MKRLLVIFLLLLTAVVSAQEYTLENYKCAVTLPPGDKWQKGYPQKLQLGEMIFNAVRPEAKQLFLIVVTDVPVDNPGSPAVVARMMEVAGAMGYRASEPAGIEVDGVKYVQFIGRRSEANASEVLMVARGTVREKMIYLTMMVGLGDETMVKDERFMRVLKSFRFLVDQTVAPPPSANPLYGRYKMGMIVCLSTVVGLAIFFGAVMLATQRPLRHRGDE